MLIQQQIDLNCQMATLAEAARQQNDVSQGLSSLQFRQTLLDFLGHPFSVLGLHFLRRALDQRRSGHDWVSRDNRCRDVNAVETDDLRRPRR